MSRRAATGKLSAMLTQSAPWRIVKACHPGYPGTSPILHWDRAGRPGLQREGPQVMLPVQLTNSGRGSLFVGGRVTYATNEKMLGRTS